MLILFIYFVQSARCKLDYHDMTVLVSNTCMVLHWYWFESCVFCSAGLVLHCITLGLFQATKKNSSCSKWQLRWMSIRYFHDCWPKPMAYSVCDISVTLCVGWTGGIDSWWVMACDSQCSKLFVSSCQLANISSWITVLPHNHFSTV